MAFIFWQHTTSHAGDESRTVRQGNGEDAAFLLSNAKDVIIVPGYGMAVAHAQHAVKELVDALERHDHKSSVCHSPGCRAHARTYECIAC